MHVTLGMIAINEEQYIEANLLQHYELADRIVIVEGADRLYPKERVTAGGLSTDRTAEIIRGFPDPSHKLHFIQHGWAPEWGGSSDQSKCELRNCYMRLVLPGLLWVVDADEFWLAGDVASIIGEAENTQNYDGWRYPVVHFWKTQNQFITGGYFDIPHTRWWNIQTGLERYEGNHNIPTRNRRLMRRLLHHDRHIHPAGAILQDHANRYQVVGPCCYHFGFCKDKINMRDKTDYYAARGENSTRPVTMKSREAWFTGTRNQPGLRLWQYGGPLPAGVRGVYEH